MFSGLLTVPTTDWLCCNFSHIDPFCCIISVLTSQHLLLTANQGKERSRRGVAGFGKKNLRNCWRPPTEAASHGAHLVNSNESPCQMQPGQDNTEMTEVKSPKPIFKKRCQPTRRAGALDPPSRSCLWFGFQHFQALLLDLYLQTESSKTWKELHDGALKLELRLASPGPIVWWRHIIITNTTKKQEAISGKIMELGMSEGSQ